MKKQNTHIQESLKNKPIEYNINIICWDDVRYNRMAQKWIIDNILIDKDL